MILREKIDLTDRHLLDYKVSCRTFLIEGKNVFMAKVNELASVDNDILLSALKVYVASGQFAVKQYISSAGSEAMVYKVDDNGDFWISVSLLFDFLISVDDKFRSDCALLMYKLNVYGFVISGSSLLGMADMYGKQVVDIENKNLIDEAICEEGSSVS